MSEERSFFFDEWRDCLHSHFLHVVENGDAITEPTLREVLQDAGVAPDLIESWYQEAIVRRTGDLPVVDIATDDIVESQAPEEIAEDVDHFENAALPEPVQVVADVQNEVLSETSDEAVETEADESVPSENAQDAETPPSEPEEKPWNPTLFDF